MRNFPYNRSCKTYSKSASQEKSTLHLILILQNNKATERGANIIKEALEGLGNIKTV
jgi:hypothetical protein